ncbi:MAG: aminoacyl-tRNA hydrolase [Candidatus Omnitrophota bacterium]
MKLIVGLGNPGFRYRNTRHNVGFMAVSHIAHKHGIRLKKRLYNGLAGEGRIAGKNVLLLLPQGFMNLSGESVKPAAGRLGGIEDMIICYDDKDLRLGRIRFREKGSSGGHKGVGSIIESLGTGEFSRLRIGIHPDNGIEDTSEFVLRPFTKGEKTVLDSVLDVTVSGIETWIKSGIGACMNRYNGACATDV